MDDILLNKHNGKTIAYMRLWLSSNNCKDKFSTITIEFEDGTSMDINACGEDGYIEVEDC